MAGIIHRAMTPEEIWELQCEVIAQRALGYLANAVAHKEANDCTFTNCGLASRQLYLFEKSVNELKELRRIGAYKYYRATYGSGVKA